MTLGSRIREYRMKRGFTQLQMAKKLEMSEANFSSYERDKSEPPSEKLKQISSILNVSTDFLLGITDDPDVKINDDKAQFNDSIRSLARELQELDPDSLDALKQIIKSMNKRGREALDE